MAVPAAWRLDCAGPKVGGADRRHSAALGEQMKTRLIALPIVVAAALGFASCGGDDDDNGTNTTTSAASAEAFCAKANEIQQLDSTFSDLAPNDIDGAKSAFQTALDTFQEADDVAPAEIKSQVDAVVSTFSEINDSIQGVDSAADLQQLGSSLQANVQDLQQELSELRSYYQDNCK
jgi:hypothetical protein